MELRIGTTLDGRPVEFDTTSTRPLLLVGDPGLGKTTLARFITRWWLAETTHHAHVLTYRPEEWADLRCHLGDGSASDPAIADCAPGCLVVIDCIDPPPTRTAAAQRRSRSVPSVITSEGGHLSWMEQDRFQALGLLPRRPVTVDERAIRAGQQRLDWPTHTVAIVPDQRGPADFPCHRWRTLAAVAGAPR